jgi:predicted ribosomally synthesized peptide with nif11-like leader
MSIANAVMFVQKLNEDKAMADSLKGMTGDQVLALASTQGLDFSMAEFEEVCEYAVSLGEELNEEDLDKVVGGFGPFLALAGLAAIPGLVAAGAGAAAAMGGFVYSIGKGESWF